jgi:hypothetical protein
MRKKVIWAIVSCVIVVVVVIVLSGRIPGVAPALEGAGKSRENAVPLGTPLAVTLYRGRQELTILGASQETYGTAGRTMVTVEVQIRAITDTTYYGWDFNIVGSKGVVYGGSGLGGMSKEIVSGTVQVEELHFTTEEGDTGEYFFVWKASVEDGIDNRYFSLQ